MAGPYPYYGATGILDYVEGYLFDEPLVLVGEDGAKWEAGENTAFPITGKCWVNNHAHVLRPHRKTLLDQWLIYFLNHSDLSSHITGLTVPKFNQGKLREIPIPLPPLPEQERIVSILDEAFAVIATATANAEKNLANARELFESQQSAIFTNLEPNWQVHKLAELINVQSGFAFRSKEYTESGHFLVRIGNVQDGYLSLDKPRYVALNEKTARFELNDGDLLTSLTGNIGRVARVNSEHLPAALNQRVARITAKTDDIDDSFLYRFLSSSVFRTALMDTGHGAAQQNVSPKEIGNIPIGVPPMLKQKEIAARFDDLQETTVRLYETYQSKLDFLTELKQSILNKAFAGELTADPASIDRALSEASV